MPKFIELNVNGTRRRVEADADRSLLSLLRDELDLTGTKYGCGEGQCGACTVLIDGQPARSCLTQVSAIAGKQITTIEGLSQGPNKLDKVDKLHPLQKAFLEAGAMQCGYCIPGMIMSGAGLLKKNPNPTDAEIMRAMEGNICRCGTYPRILAAFRRVSNIARAGKGGAND
jgi:isoquinoline 1-oxidoreductase subunit alpha